MQIGQHGERLDCFGCGIKKGIPVRCKILKVEQKWYNEDPNNVCGKCPFYKTQKQLDAEWKLYGSPEKKRGAE